MNRHTQKGFTLIEVLVVIGIIAVLATIVLVAVNPARQFKLARDTQRTANVNAILNAIHQNIAEHRGILTCKGTPLVIFNAPSDIASAGGQPTYLDLAVCLVPDYLSAMPFDPSAPNAHYNAVDAYDTDYFVSQDVDGRITVSANGELAGPISVTR